MVTGRSWFARLDTPSWASPADLASDWDAGTRVRATRATGFRKDRTARVPVRR